uniref:DOMON domain-containing protein n=1 Tax=Panagrolaimus davidi TaxID=227884 RepID=A0A914PKP0_9BILA
MAFKYLIVLACIVSALAQMSSNNFDASKCGTQKRCINIPNNCQSGGNCQYQISYAPAADGKSMIIELYGRRDSPSMQYVAIGFSTDTQMGNEPVAACIVTPNGQAQLSYSFNQEGRRNVPLGPINPTDSQLLSSSVTPNSIYCKFSQSIIPTTNQALPNLQRPYNLLLARGPIQPNGQLGRHTDRQALSTMTSMAQ